MKQWLLVGLWLASTASAHAGSTVIAFDFDLAVFPGTKFVMKDRTVAGTTTAQREVPLEPFTRAQCQALPGIQMRPTTICAAVCLNPGDHTLTVYATKPGFSQSPDAKPELDVDVTETTPCILPTQPPLPIVPPPPLPPQQPPPSYEGPTPEELAAALAAMALMKQADIAMPFAMVNLGCVTWAITGVCMCTPVTPCVQVSYWEPGWIVETVKRPGTTRLTFAKPLLDFIWSAFKIPPLGGGGSAGTGGGTGQTNLSYSEVHVFEFPQIFGGPCTSCKPGDPLLKANFLSEIDPTWRIAKALVPGLPIGVWGPLSPRGGKVVHSSEPVASGLVATRGMSIAFAPIAPPPNPDIHYVIKPIDQPGTCCQLASPKPTPCMPVGTPPGIWDKMAVSPSGTYSWIFWRQRRCCVLPAQAHCGITLLGGYGQNICPIGLP